MSDPPSGSGRDRIDLLRIILIGARLTTLQLWDVISTTRHCASQRSMYNRSLYRPTRIAGAYSEPSLIARASNTLRASSIAWLPAADRVFSSSRPDRNNLKGFDLTFQCSTWPLRGKCHVRFAVGIVPQLTIVGAGGEN